LLRFVVVKVSASPTGNVTKKSFKFQAARFMRWRKRWIAAKKRKRQS
jgi:hypothetical protein